MKANRPSARAVLLVVASLLYPPLIAGVVYRLSGINWSPTRLLSPDELRIATYVLGVIAAFNIASPWQRSTRWVALAQTSGNQDLATALLIGGFPFNIAPASYGLLLYVLGARALVTACFAAASLIAASVWAIAALRRGRVTRTDY